MLWGEKIFLLSADPKTATRYVLCINAADGKTIWRRDYPGVPHHLHANSSFASVTPAVDAERVYVAWSDPDFTRLMALDHAGNEVWTHQPRPLGQPARLWQLADALPGPGRHQLLAGRLEGHGDPRQPKESFIVAVEQSTGKIRWRTDRKINSASYSVPTRAQERSGPGRAALQHAGRGLFALDPEDGQGELVAAGAFDALGQLPAVCRGPGLRHDGRGRRRPLLSVASASPGSRAAR